MRRRDWLLSTTAATAATPVLRAQAGTSASASPQLLNAAQRREGYHRSLSRRAAAVTRSQFRDIANRSQWEEVRPQVAESLRWELGLPSEPRATPLHAKVTSRLRRNGYSIENIVFQSSPGLYVTGNLYVPAERAGGPAPAVVYVCGHSPSPLGAKISYQHHALWFVKQGFVVFVLDTIEFGEISGIHHGTHNLEWWHWLSIGYNPAAVEVWNAMRALDYLETREEVDRTRVSITGRSGGGAVSWFTAAVDERFSVAVPVHGTWAIEPHIRDYVVRENCDCIYVWNSELLDLTSIGALIAPRPLMIVNGRRDPCFPPSGYEVVGEQLQKVYGWYGAADRFTTFEADTGHQDTLEYRKATNLWITRWTKNEAPAYSEDGIEREADPSVLRVLPGVPADATNEGIDRIFIPAAESPSVSSLSVWTERKSVLAQLLQSKLLRGLAPRNHPFATRKRPLQNWTTRYANAWNIQFETEPDLTVNGQLFVPENPSNRQSALIYVKGADDLVYGIDYDDILSLLTQNVVLVLRPRTADYGMSNLELAETKMSAALLGTTLENLQLHDVLRAIDFLFEDEQFPLRSLTVFGRQSMAMVGIYAGAVEERISRVVVDRPPESHWDGPAIMHALRYTDVPEVAALIAPRELAFLGRIPAAYRSTETIANLYPDGRKIRHVNSLGDAMRADSGGTKL